MPQDRFEQYVVRAQRFGARTVFFQNAAARLLGLTATELECFRLVQHEGPLTASHLANETGFTRPSLSVVVDNLVKRKFLSRRQDRHDRRRWLLRANQAAIAEVDAIYAAHASRAAKLLDGYSDEEFEVVLHFMERFADELKNTAIRMTQGTSASGRGKT